MTKYEKGYANAKDNKAHNYAKFSRVRGRCKYMQ